MERKHLVLTAGAVAILICFAWFFRYDVTWNRDQARILDRWTGRICGAYLYSEQPARCKPASS